MAGFWPVMPRAACRAPGRLHRFGPGSQRGWIERTSRDVYRVPYLPPGRFPQYREAELWAISHTTALGAYDISDANPHSIHITVPKAARLKAAKT
jgi:predicted transcriptional regulator of viral defense system